MKKTVLVTGGAGFIGSVCVEMLIKKRFKTIVIDNLQTGHRQAVDPDAVFVRGNIGKQSLLNSIFKRYSVQTVIHFAAETEVGKANTHPHLYFENNLSNGITLLNSMLKYGCKQIIFSSTAAVYGETRQSPISEDAIKGPLNAYGESKLMFEQILRHYASAHSLQYFTFRYFNAAGASKTHGEFHRPETHLIPLVLEVAQNKRDQVSIFGDDYNTPDGSCLRDYVHVIDIAQAHISAISKFDRLPNSVFNLGNQKGISVKKIIAISSQVTGKKIPFTITNRRAGDPARLIANSSKAISELNWQPKRSSAQEIINTAWRWMSLHPSGYKKK